jgi:hypothetical protein
MDQLQSCAVGGGLMMVGVPAGGGIFCTLPECRWDEFAQPSPD